MAPEDEILNLMRDVKRETYRKLEQDERTIVSWLNGVDHLLATAIADYEEGKYQLAEDQFRQLLVDLKGNEFLKDKWAELCLLIAVCEYRRGNKRAAKMAFKEARCFESDNRKLNRIATKWDFDTSDLT